MTRTFTIEQVTTPNGSVVRYTGGRFISESPIAAARKMFTKAYHHSGKPTLRITLRETTSGSKKKIYMYRISRVADKITVEIDGEKMTFFTTKVKSLN